MLIAWIKVWMAVTNLTHSRQKVDVCRSVWFSVRSLLCKSFWANSGDVQAETKMRRLLGKVGRDLSDSQKNSFLGKLKRFSVRNLKCAGFCKNRGENRSENPICRFQGKLGWLNPCFFRTEIWICRFLGKLGEFFGEISANSEIWMKCSHRSHDVHTICFFKAFCSHGCSHVARVFARCSHDLPFQGFSFARMFVHFAHVRTQAVGQRVCARFERNLNKSREIRSFRLARPKIFEFFAKKNLDQLKMNTSECFGYLSTPVYSVLKLKILQTSWWFCWKTFWPT